MIAAMAQDTKYLVFMILSPFLVANEIAEPDRRDCSSVHVQNRLTPSNRRGSAEPSRMDCEASRMGDARDASVIQILRLFECLPTRG
jgi:hypothetical protein